MKNANFKFSELVLKNSVQTLKAFSHSVISGNDIILNDKYQVDASSNQITFSLEFNNVGAATTTDVFLDSLKKVDAANGSLINSLVDTDLNVDGKFLKIFSAVTATSLTPLPDDLKVDFTISGGVNDVTYPLSAFKLNAAGDTVNLDIEILKLFIEVF